MTRIESPKNLLIQATVTLHERRARTQQRLILVEGQHPIEEALQTGLTLRHLFVREGGQQPVSGKEIFKATEARIEVTDRVMEKLATTSTPPPCVAVFETPRFDREALWSSPVAPLFLVLDRLQDPGNLGTLLRAALAFGVTAVFTTAGTVDVWSPKVIRSTAGQVFRLPVFEEDTGLAETLQPFQAQGLPLIGCTAHAGIPYREVSYRESCVLVLGSEAHGISDVISETPNTPGWTWVTIPMAEGVESLNVAVSGAIVLSEAAWQRQESR